MHDSVKGGVVDRAWPHQGHIMRDLTHECAFLAHTYRCNAIRCGISDGCSDMGCDYGTHTSMPGEMV